jgi:hypothetical protein
MTDNPQYTEVEYNGNTVRQYPDGALRQANGQLVAQHPLAAATITEETSPLLNKRRWDLEHARVAEEREETQRAIAASLMQQVGTKSAPKALGKLSGLLVAEMAHETAPKEHGISNYVKVLKEVGQMAGLIQEKVTDNRQVNIENINLSPDAEAHVAMLLERLQERLLTRDGEGT